MTLVPIFIAVLFLAFANGANDISKSVATLVGSGVTDYRRAMQWGAAWTTVGALLSGRLAVSVAGRFADSLGIVAGGIGKFPSRCFSLPLSGSLFHRASACRSQLHTQ